MLPTTIRQSRTTVFLQVFFFSNLPQQSDSGIPTSNTKGIAQKAQAKISLKINQLQSVNSYSITNQNRSREPTTISIDSLS